MFGVAARPSLWLGPSGISSLAQDLVQRSRIHGTFYSSKWLQYSVTTLLLAVDRVFVSLTVGTCLQYVTTIGKDTSLAAIETHCIAPRSSSPCFRHRVCHRPLGVFGKVKSQGCRIVLQCMVLGRLALRAEYKGSCSGRGVEPMHTATVICTSGG